MGSILRASLAALLGLCAAAAQPATNSIAIATHGGHLRLTAYSYSAWAICSLRIGGIEYIDAYDHGRCLQSAASFDDQGEAFNPTQAGGFLDGLMPGASSSVPLVFRADHRSLASTVRMAFWNPVNQERTSAYVHRQQVTVGLGPARNVIAHKISFDIPASNAPGLGQFENLTGYMPPQFAHFRTLDPATGELREVDDGPGEQALPLIFCTSDDRHCMGVISPRPLVGGGYGRWRFEGETCMTRRGPSGCVKWNVVTRVADPSGTYRAPPIYTAVGNLRDVVTGLRWAWESGDQ